MQTVGRKYSGPKRNYAHACDACGVSWHRSKLRRSANGTLLCPDDWPGMVEVQLDALSHPPFGFPVLPASDAAAVTAPWWTNPLGTPANPNPDPTTGATPPTSGGTEPAIPDPISFFDDGLESSGGADPGGLASLQAQAPWTVTAGVPVLFVISHRRGTIASISGLTWTLAGYASDGAGPTTNLVVAAYTAVSGATVTIQPTVTFNGAVTLPNHVDLEAYSLGLASPSSPIVQSASAAGSGTSSLVTLAPFGSSRNSTYSAIIVANPTAGTLHITAGTGFEGDAGGSGTTQAGQEAKSTPDTSVDWSFNKSADYAHLAMEVRAL